MSTNEQQLLDQWVYHRDAEAFRTIANRYAGLVYATCRRILGNPTEAQDVTQECFEALAVSDRRPGAYLAPWLHRVATTKSLQRIRSDQSRKRREDAFTPVTADPVAEVVRRDLYWVVDEAIVALPEELRVPIVAHFLEDKTHETIAAELGVSRQTVTYRIGKGIDLIRKRLLADRAFSFATLAGLLKPIDTTPPTLLAALGKLALAGPAVSFGGLATFGTAKAIMTAIAVVCAGGLTVVYGLGARPGAASKAPTVQADVSTAQADAVQRPMVAAVAPAPAPASVTGAVAAPAAQPSEEDAITDSAPQFPKPPERFVPHAFLEEGIENGEVVFSARHFIISETIRRTEFTDGRLIIFDLGNSSDLLIDASNKTARKTTYEDIRPAKHYHHVDMMWMNAGPEGPQYVGTKTVEGKECNGFRADNPNFAATLWLDKQTNLPVRMEGLQKVTGRTIIESEYDFQINTDPKRFEMTAPEGYEYSEQVVRNTWWSRLVRKAQYWWSVMQF